MLAPMIASKAFTPPAPVDAAPGAKTARTTDNGPPRAPSAFMRKSALIPSRCRRVKRCDVSVKLLSAVALSRSEEHTSELQSLMRTSYAVFCLKKKKKDKTHTTA